MSTLNRAAAGAALLAALAAGCSSVAATHSGTVNSNHPKPSSPAPATPPAKPAVAKPKPPSNLPMHHHKHVKAAHPAAPPAPVTTPPAPPAPVMTPMAPPANSVPQNGGGDGDSDNFGGSNDGDGGV